MAINQQTLLKIQSLEQLYRNGYRRNTVDAAIDKLVGIEQTCVEQELARLEGRLRKLELGDTTMSREMTVEAIGYWASCSKLC